MLNHSMDLQQDSYKTVGTKPLLNYSAEKADANPRGLQPKRVGKSLTKLPIVGNSEKKFVDPNRQKSMDSNYHSQYLPHVPRKDLPQNTHFYL